MENSRFAFFSSSLRT